MELPDTFSWRDRPVLIEIVRQFDTGAMSFADADASAMASILALDEDQVWAALAALRDAGYIWGRQYGGGMQVTGISAGARRIAGTWPTDDTGERFLAALDRLIAASTAQDEPKLKNLLDAVRDVGTNVVAGLIAAAITGS